jgi:predicted secreted protein
MQRPWSPILAALSFAVSLPAVAAPMPAPQISLHLNEPFTVPAAELHAELAAEAQAPHAADAAQRVNEELRWAEKKLAATPQIHWQLGNYASQRLADDKGWQLRGELQLRAAPDVVLPVLATLQSRLQLLSLQTQPSAASVRAAEAQARKELLQRFRNDAESACADLGLHWGGIERVELRSSATQPTPRIMGPALLAAMPAPVSAGHAESQWLSTLDGVAFCQK